MTLAAGAWATLLDAVGAALALAGVWAGLQALGGRRWVRIFAGTAVTFGVAVLAAFAAAALPALGFSVWSVAFLIGWWRRPSGLAFGLSSFSLAAACLASPLALLQGAAMPLVFKAASWRRPNPSGPTGALSLAYLTPTAAGLLLWLLVRLAVR